MLEVTSSGSRRSSPRERLEGTARVDRDQLVRPSTGRVPQPFSPPRETAGVVEGNRGLSQWPTTDLVQKPARGEGCGRGPSGSRRGAGPASLVEEEPKAKRRSQEQGAVPMEHAPAHQEKRRLDLEALTFSREQWAKFVREKNNNKQTKKKKKTLRQLAYLLLKGERLHRSVVRRRRERKRKGQSTHSLYGLW